ncbi:MAG: hypothetical protein GX235_10760 [Clostridiales bacterium]|nr:hypothetical protein [Clostridiales bacterium]
MKFKRKKLKNSVLIMTLIALLGNSLPVYAAEAAASGTPPLITSFVEIPSDVSNLSFDDRPDLSAITAGLPQNLSVYLDASEASTDIPVTWACTSDYDNTDYETYDFIPSWDNTLYPLSPSLDASKDVPHISVSVNAEKSSVYLSDPENAKNELDTIVQSKAVLALVYLCDSYDIKQNPYSRSASAVTVYSGQSVQITGVSEDSRKNIWYKVSLDVQGTSYSGYVEREFLAYSDEDLLAWESQYVTTKKLLKARAFSLQSFSASTVSEEISKFPESYQSALSTLKAVHPNWIFVKMDTGLDWSSAIANENIKDRSLISSSANVAWKTASYDKNWAYPTDGILAYYMDPRNFLTDKYIFQFELLSYNATYHTETAVQSMLDGTFMSGIIPEDSRTYSQAFTNIGQTLNVSPFHLASRVRQEQGAGNSALISGNYPGYEGLYNYFNIGATGKGDQQVIESGLAKAREYGWTSRYLSLYGGSDIISKNYIRKGQDTLYLQKFNVNSKSTYGLFNHQYMQNIAAPSSEAVSVKNAYASAGSVDKPFVFKIPVYDNMPGTACKQPSTLKEVTLDKTSLSLAVDATSTLTAFADGSKVSASGVTFASADSSIATVDANGTVTAIYPGTTTITATVSGGSTASCTITVLKVDPAYTIPALSGITYSPSQTLSNIPLPSGWTWDSPATIPTVTNSGYPATFTPSDAGKYNTINKILTLTVSKGTPAYTVPTGLQTVVGNTLASITLPAGFTWEVPSTVLSKEGSAAYKASYNPDTANYNTVTGIDITITINAKASTPCATHIFGEWEHITAATCTTAGSDSRSCHVCGYKETRTVAALGHVYTSTVTKQATEAETGIRTYTCSICGDKYTEVIDKLPVSHKHSYTSAITKEASCTEKGMKTYTCSCGSTYTEDIPALGHSYTSKVTKEATEKETGIRTYTCVRCSDSYTEIIAKLPSNHTHSYTSAVTKEATCTEKGVKTYTCSCGSTYTEDISALGHNMTNGKCTRCGYTESQSSSGSTSSSGNTISAASSGTASSGTASNGSSTDTSLASGTPAANASNPQADGPSGTTTSSKGSSSSKRNNSSDKGKAVSGHATIDMKENTVLYEEALTSIRGKDVDVVLSMGNSISWTINGSNIVADEANGIDMGITVNAGNIPSGLLAAAKGDNENNTIIELSLAHDGTFDFAPVLTINTAKDNAGRMANLFYYNPDTNELEFIDAVEVSETGDISFTFSHASDYAVIISDTSMAELTVIKEAAADGELSGDAEAEDVSATDTLDNGASTGNNILNPRIIAIIVIIILVCVAVGVTVFFLFRKKDDEDDEDFEEESTAEDEDDDDKDFVDDYYEPEVNTKKTGKVISMKKLKAEEKNATAKQTDPEDDEFDGFE